MMLVGLVGSIGLGIAVLKGLLTLACNTPCWSAQYTYTPCDIFDSTSGTLDQAVEGRSSATTWLLLSYKRQVNRRRHTQGSHGH